MVLDSAQIATLLNGVVLAFIAFGSRLSTSSRRTRREKRRLQEVVELQDAALHAHRRVLRQHGISPPPLPDGLAELIEEDDVDG